MDDLNPLTVKVKELLATRECSFPHVCVSPRKGSFNPSEFRLFEMKHQFLTALRKVVRTPLSNGKHAFPADSELLIMDDSDRSRATSSRLMEKLETAMNFLEAVAFFDFSSGPVRGLLAQTDHVWDALALLPAYIENVMRPEVFGEVEEGARLESERVQLGEGSRVERGAII